MESDESPAEGRVGLLSLFRRKKKPKRDETTLLEQLEASWDQKILETMLQAVETREAMEDDGSVYEPTGKTSKDSSSEGGDDEDDNAHVWNNATLVLFGSNGVLSGATGGAQAIEEDAWKKDLTEEEIERYGWIFNELNDRFIDIPRIIRCNMTDAEKKNAIEIMVTQSTESSAYQNMVKLVKEREKTPLNLERLKFYDEQQRFLDQSQLQTSSLRFQILDLPLPMPIKKVVWDVFRQYEQAETSPGERYKHFEYLQWVLKLPFGKMTPTPLIRNTSELRELLLNLRSSLDQSVWGMNDVKEELMLFAMDRMIPSVAASSEMSSRVLAIQGSPGVGKTHLVKTMAHAWGLPFQLIAAGGCKDSSFWDGHGRTYEGSLPGHIVQSLCQMQSMNGIICIDELDKITRHEHAKDVTSILLHLLDPSQNNAFQDKYLGTLPLDLSKIFWVVLINDEKKIDPILRDRLYIVRVPDPKLNDKINTAQKIMIPRAIAAEHLEPDDVSFTDDCLRWIVEEKCAGEKGVRTLKSLIQAIVRRVAYLKFTLVAIPEPIIWNAAKRSPNESVVGVAKTIDNKERFRRVTPFLLDDFRIPLVIDIKRAKKLLVHYKVGTGLLDYKKRGWIS